MNNLDFVFNSINLWSFYAFLTWYVGVIFTKKTLRFKGVNDPKSFLLLLSAQFLLYVLLSITTKLFFIDLKLWGEFFTIITTVLVLLPLIILNLSLPRLNLRNKLKRPNKTNIILWTICEILLLILSSSYILALFAHANIQYNTSIALNSYLFVIWGEFIYITAICGAPMWIIMLLQSVRIQELAKNYQTITSVKGCDAPIVYLRTFGLDKTPALNNKTFDEYLFESLKNPIVISLADPNEIFPSGGSIKIQARDESWKEVVKQLLLQARAVIIVMGETEGLKWEISQLRQYLAPSQLYIVIPPFYYSSLAWCDYFWKNKEILPEYEDNGNKNLLQLFSLLFFYRRNRKYIRTLWAKFVRELNNEGLPVEGPFPGFNRVISFDSDWKPESCNRSLNGKAIINFILNNSQTEKTCDYKGLSNLIEKYEVNGFVPNKYVAHYRNIIIKIVGFYGAFCILLLSIVILIFAARGMNTFTERKEFKDFMSPETCRRVYFYCLREKDQQAYKH